MRYSYDFDTWQDLVTFANEEVDFIHPDLYSLRTDCSVTLVIETEDV